MPKISKNKKTRRKEYKQMRKSLEVLTQKYEDLKKEFRKVKAENDNFHNEQIAFSKALTQESNYVIYQKAKTFFDSVKPSIEEAAKNGEKNYLCKIPNEVNFYQLHRFIYCVRSLMPGVIIYKSGHGWLNFEWK